MLCKGTLGKAALWQSVFHLEPASGRRCCPESEAQLLVCEQMHSCDTGLNRPTLGDRIPKLLLKDHSLYSFSRLANTVSSRE